MDEFTVDVLTTDPQMGSTEFDDAPQNEQCEQQIDQTENGFEQTDENESAENEDDRKLFVGGLSPDSTQEHIKLYFEKYGEVEKCELKLHPETGKSRRFAFVLFKNIESVNKTLAEKSHTLDGRTIDPKLANKREINTKIFVGGLSKDATDDDIRKYFEQFGKIKEMDLPVDINNKRRGFCFINYENKDGMEKASHTRFQTICGKQCEVKKSTPKNQSKGAFFGDRGRGRGYFPGYHPYGGQPNYYGNPYGYSGGYGGGYDDYYGGYGAYGDGSWQGYDQSYAYGTGYQAQQSSYGKMKRGGRGGGGYGGY